MTLSRNAPSRTAVIAGLLASALSLAGVPALGKTPPKSPAAPASDRIKIDVATFTLPNGLTTIVHTDHTVPSVYIGIRYRTGSKDEPAGKTGFAHLFEHLMFQSTKNRQGDFLPQITAVGATDVNGTTTSDGTEYFETIPTNALDYALWMESDRMGNLAGGITQKELDEQRGVVENEKRQGELQPGAKAQDRYFANYYPAGHPYAHTTIGSMDDLDRASLADVKQWFNDYYGASNAVLVLSGDIDLATAKQKVAKYFGSVRPGKAIDHIAQWVPHFTEVKRDVLYDKIGNATLHRGWPLPNDDPRAITLLQLAARSMAGRKSTPLDKSLVDDEQIAFAVTASVTEHQLDSSFDIDLALRPGVSPEKAGKALDAVLARFFVTGPDKKRLDTVIAATNVSLVRMGESAPAVGSSLLHSYFDYGDPLHFVQQRDWITTATPEEVRRLAKAWLQRPYYEMQMLPQPTLQADPVEVDRSKPPALGPFKGTVKFPPIREARLSNGMKLVVAERPGVPMVDISMQFATGTSVDSAYATGAARQAFEMLASGSDKYTPAALVEQISHLGMNFSAKVGGRQSGVSWSTLTSALDGSFAVSAEVIRHPSYPQAEIAQMSANVDTQFEDYERNPIGDGGSVYSAAIWGKDHPFGKMVTREEAKKLSRDAVVRFHDHEIGPNTATLYALGDITLEQARALAEKYFGDWKPVAPATSPNAVPAQGIPGRIILVDAPGAPQSSISVGHLVGPFVKADAASELLAGNVIGASFDSRLNSDLREQKGWAYGFSGGIANSPFGDRVFTMGGTVQADKTAASMAEIKRDLADFVGTKPITDKELQREKLAAMRAIPSGFSSNGAFLSAMIGSASYGLPLTYSEGTSQRISSVSLDQVRGWAARTYKPDALTWVVVGDLALIEKDIRSLNLGPVEVWDVYGHKIR